MYNRILKVIKVCTALTVLFMMGNIDIAISAPTSTELANTNITEPGVRVTIPPTTQPPILSSEQNQVVQDHAPRLGPDYPLLAPTAGNALTRPANAPVEDPQKKSTNAAIAATPLDPAIFRSNLVPFLGQRSGVNEPSVDGSGKYTFLTGNWYAARSSDNGATWTYVNPFASYTGSTNFCCDQLTAYDASRNRQYWLRQYSAHLEISNSPGNNLASWCTYKFTPAMFGITAAGANFDYNKMALSTNYLYVTTNVYANAGYLGALVFRVSLNDQPTCGSAGFGWFGPRNTEFSNAPVNGASDTMYWGTNWMSGGTIARGTGMRVFRWADNSGTVSWFDKPIDSYSFMSVNGSQRCGSATGAVLNWCQRTDSRTTGNGYIALASLAQKSSMGSWDNDSVVGFAFNANQDTAHPKPYIRRVYFRTSDVAYLGRSELWNPTVAFLYPDLAVNARGHVGMVWAWGGGTGANNYYPGYGFTIDDDINQTQSWYTNYYVFGAGNACLNTSDNTRRWGDYLSIHTLNPSKLVWIASGFRMNAATNCVSGQSVPQAEVRTFVFGRLRDQQAYIRGSAF